MLAMSMGRITTFLGISKRLVN